MSPKPNETELLKAITQTELGHQFAQPVSIQIKLAQQKNQTIKTGSIQTIVRWNGGEGETARMQEIDS